jgi:hypothetical protein
MIDTALELGLGEPEETYSSSEHLYAMLNIPAGSNGRIVKANPVKTEKSEPAVKAEPRKEKSEDRTPRVRTRTKKFNS